MNRWFKPSSLVRFTVTVSVACVTIVGPGFVSAPVVFDQPDVEPYRWTYTFAARAGGGLVRSAPNAAKTTSPPIPRALRLVPTPFGPRVRRAGRIKGLPRDGASRSFIGVARSACCATQKIAEPEYTP